MHRRHINLFLWVFQAILLSSVLAQYENFYCGLEPCILPLRLTCEQLIEEYAFQGSCCSMETMNETLGCRVTVGARGNCFWSPKCGDCDLADEQLGCNRIHTTDSDSNCPESEFDPVAESNFTVSCPPEAAPTSPPTLAPVSSGTTLDHRFVGLVSATIVVLAQSLVAP
jgi:hypothetical protein